MFKYIILKLLNVVLKYVCFFIKIPYLINLKSVLVHKEDLIKLNRLGVTLGKGSVVYGSTFSSSSGGDKFYIGDNTTITGSILLAHDASPTIFIPELKCKNDPWLPGARRSFRDPIKIGNNVFIGYGSIILPGVHIGDNIVIAAGSVVTGNVASNSVYGGNPAKFIKSIDSYISKYEKKLIDSPNSF